MNKVLKPRGNVSFNEEIAQLALIVERRTSLCAAAQYIEYVDLFSLELGSVHVDLNQIVFFFLH